MLGIFLPGSEPKKVFSSIKRKVIEPAIDLAEKVQLSVDKFSIEWTHSPRPELSDEPFSSFQCLNILPPNRLLKFPAAKENNVIQYICDIYPGLVIEAVNGDSFGIPKVLSPAKILVAATRMRDGPFLRPQPNGGECVTLLGHLEDEISREGS